jgi:hypothetical protein
LYNENCSGGARRKYLSDILLATKLQFPPLHGNLANRQYMIGRLNEGTKQSHQMTLFFATAGFGKSTLLSYKKNKHHGCFSSVEGLMILVTPFFPLVKTQAGMTRLLDPWLE